MFFVWAVQIVPLSWMDTFWQALDSKEPRTFRWWGIDTPDPNDSGLVFRMLSGSIQSIWQMILSSLLVHCGNETDHRHNHLLAGGVQRVPWLTEELKVLK